MTSDPTPGDPTNHTESEDPKPGCYEKCVTALMGVLPQMFAKYALFAQSYSRGYSCFAMIFYTLLLVACLVGFRDVEFQDSLEETWIDNDSRIQDEKDFYDKHYGGLASLELLVVSDRTSANSIGSQSHLNALVYAAGGVMNHAETCTGCGTAGTVTNTREPSFSFTNDAGSTSTYYSKDMCDQNPVPTSIGPCPTCTETGAASVAYLSTGNYATWGYAKLSKCLWDNKDTTNTGAISPLQIPNNGYLTVSDWSLPVTWGIDRFPCSSYSIVQMFREGENLGFPACMRVLDADRSSGQLGGVPFGTADALYWWTGQGAAAGGPSTDSSGCIEGTPGNSHTSVKALYTAHLQAAGMTSAVATAAATQYVTALKAWIVQFYGMGFRHRTSFADLATQAIANGATDDGQDIITKFIDQARVNQNYPAKTVLQCKTSLFTYTAVNGAVLTGNTKNGVANSPASMPWYFPCIMNGLTTALSERLILSDDRTCSGTTCTRYGQTRTTMSVPHHNDFLFKQRMTTVGITTESSRKKLTETWEDTLFDYLKPMWEQTESAFAANTGTYKNTKIDFFMFAKSFRDQLSETANPTESLVFLLAGVLLILLFSMLWYFPCSSNSPGARVLSVISFSFVVLLLCIAAGYGLMLWFNLKLSVTSPVVMLVGLGLGIDDVYVLINAYIHALYHNREDVIVHAFTSAGPSVLITTLSNIIGFSMGMLMPVAAVQEFCLQMSVTCAVLLGAIILLIMPFMVLHFECIKDNLPVKEEPTIMVSLGQTEGLTNPSLPSFVKTKVDELDATAPPNLEEGVPAQAQPDANLDSTAPPTKPRAPCLSVAMRRYFKHYHYHFLRQTSVKIAVLVLSAGMFGVALWAMIEKLDIGLSLKEVSNEGSYQYEFTEANDKFSGYGARIVSRQTSWASAAIQTQSKVQDDALMTSKFVSWANPIHSVNWLYNGTKTLIGLSGGSFTDDIYTVNGATGLSPFTTWMLSSGALFENFLVCHTTQTSGVQCRCTDGTYPNRRIIAASHAMVLTGLSSTEDFVDMIKETRDLSDDQNKNGNDAYLYGTTYLYWEQYLNIHENLWILAAYCIAGITVLNLFLQVSLRAAVLTCAILAVYVVEMMGSIVLMDIKLNAFSLVNIVVSIGFAVEYIVHYTRAYIVASGTADDRMKEALTEIGPAVFAGGFSAFLATLPLCFSPIKIFQLYFFQMFGMAAFLGLFQGLLVWPVILSLAGVESSAATKYVAPIPPRKPSGEDPVC